MRHPFPSWCRRLAVAGQVLLVLAVVVRPGASLAGQEVADADGDGVPDATDRCPGEAGMPFDGCPCKIPLTPWSEIRFTQRPEFLLQASDVQPDDLAYLNEVAALLLEHPEIKRVALLGQASSDEGPDLRALGLRRAAAVRAVLLAAGVAPERLEIGAWPDARDGREVELVVCPELGCGLPGWGLFHIE